MANERTILVLGAGGYLGATTVAEAVAAHRPVVGLVRNQAAAERLRALGAQACIGDATRPQEWRAALMNADVVIDLIQPAFPRRITRRALRRVALERAAVTRAVCGAIAALPADHRPTYLSVGGCDELAATDGVMRDASARRTRLVGGGRIGAPAYEVLASSGLPFASVYLGTVYGAGKAFATAILPGIAAGSFPIIGSGNNRLPLIHVEDAARALVHIAGLGTRSVGQSFVVAHPCGSTSSAFFDTIASALGARRPRHLPAWLVGLVAGAGAVELMSADARVESEGLVRTGFSLRFPTLEAGVAAMVQAFRSQRAAAMPSPS
jgi:nucleoside-diphosphate-sugar epimerase